MKSILYSIILSAFLTWLMGVLVEKTIDPRKYKCPLGAILFFMINMVNVLIWLIILNQWI